MANKVYVILHGLITLVEDTVANTFLAFLIDMPDHRVAAGHWLLETTIPKGALLQLTNVQRDATVPVAAAKLDPAKNIIFPSTGSGVDQAKRNQYRYAEIVLPRPTRITSLNSTNVRPDLNVAPVPPNMGVISDTQVFEYNVLPGDPQPRPSLVGEPATPWDGFEFFAGVVPGVGITSSTIHIFNEPDAKAEAAHIEEEFRRTAEIFKSPLRRGNGGRPGSLDPVPPALLPALLHEELLPLGIVEHRDRLLEMAEQARKGVAFVTAPPGGPVGGGLVCSGGHGSKP